MAKGAIPAAVFLVLMFVPPFSEQSGWNIVWLVVFQALFYVFLTVYVTPFFALLPEMGHTPEDAVQDDGPDQWQLQYSHCYDLSVGIDRSFQRTGFRASCRKSDLENTRTKKRSGTGKNSAVAKLKLPILRRIQKI